MKVSIRSMCVIFSGLAFVCLFANAGCRLSALPAGSPTEIGNEPNTAASYARYAPVKVDIMPLTEYVDLGDARQSEIRLYVALLDSSGSHVKSPARFRFELYQQVPRSAEAKGKRIKIWPHLDLNDPLKNNEYWRDFLRAYEFTLTVEQSRERSHILQVTCMCPNGRRLSSEFTLEHPE